MAYIEVEITGGTGEINEMIVAVLMENGYEGFEELGTSIKGYVGPSDFDEGVLIDLAERFQLRYSVSEMEDEDWNAVWESEFEPVIIEDFCAVRAGHHLPVKDVVHEIVITPKMSFGTGHHATTYMMIGQMKHIAFRGRRVLDFGTGTGVLAILAHKLGASQVAAVDNDDWSIANAGENFSANDAGGIELLQADDARLRKSFDIILANIIRTVIEANLDAFREQLVPGGTLLVSGLLPSDGPPLIEKAEALGFRLSGKLSRDNWVCLEFGLA